TKAYYIWKDRNQPDKTVTIELGDDGSLLTYSRNDCPGSDMQLSDAELKLTALRFAARHRPLTFMNFIFQAREERNGCIRFIYT
ncbi:YcdB/YcdC domain-containing protein, partial [Bacillus pumilus]